MVLLASAALALYYITFSIEPQVGRRIEQTSKNIVKELSLGYRDMIVVYKFKVAGEPKFVAVVQANATGLERLNKKVLRTGVITTECQPIIAYEAFAKNLGVSDDLTQPFEGTINPEHLHLLTFRVQNFKQNIQQLLNAWKSEAESVLRARILGSLNVILFKVLATRTVIAFINEDPVGLDKMSFELPLAKAIGSGLEFDTKDIIPL